MNVIRMPRPADRTDPFLTTHGTPRKRPMYAQLPPDEELPGLLSEHGTFAAVARAVGCSDTAVSYRCRRLGLKSPQRRGGKRACAICRTSSEDAAILRFGVTRQTRVAGHPTTRSAGPIFLCESCWRSIATGPRITPGRPRAAVA